MTTPSLLVLASGSWTSLDVLNHLWQSTAAGLAVFGLLIICAPLSARTRRAIGLMAMVKFVIPVAVLAGFVTHFFGRSERWLESPALTLPVNFSPETFVPVAVISPAQIPPPAHASVGLLVGLGWAAGFVAIFGWWLVRGWGLRRRILASTSPVSPAMERLIARAAERVGLRRIPRCATVDETHDAGALGLFAPIVILPRGLENTLTPAEFEAVLIHEFVHVQRRDNLWSALQYLLASLFWFHPIVWLLNRRVGLEAEKSCDERVLEITGDPEVYAGGLIKCVRHALGVSQPNLASVTTPPVVARMQNILAHGTRRDRPVARTVAFVTGLAVLGFSGCAGSFANGGLAVAARSQPTTPPPASGTETRASSSAHTTIVAGEDRPVPKYQQNQQTRAYEVAGFTKQQTLTVDFVDEGVRDIVRQVADRLELNILMPETLQAKATLKATNQTWREIFKAVLGPAGYVYVEDDNIVKIVRAPDQKTAAAGTISVYVLQPGDLIRVKVVPGLSLKGEDGRLVGLAEDSTVALPLIGKIDLTDCTVAQAQDRIRARYEAKLPQSPAVAIEVVEYHRRAVAANQPESITRIASPDQKPATAKDRETLSVDFPDEEIRQILYNVGNLFELKLVMPDALQGKTTIKLRNVTWRQIFREVLEPVGYGFIEDGRNIRIVPVATSFRWSDGSSAPDPANVRPRNEAAQGYLNAQTDRLRRESAEARQKLEAVKNAGAEPSEDAIKALTRDAEVKANQLAGIEKRVAEVKTAAASVTETTPSTETTIKPEAEAPLQRQPSDQDRAKSQNMISLDVVNERLKASNQKMLPSGEIVSLTSAILAGPFPLSKTTGGAGTLTLVKTGVGTLTLSGVGAFTGGTTLGAGTLNVAPIGNGGAPSNPVKTPSEDPATTEVFRLTFVKADDVLPKISPLIDPAFGKVVVDARSNSLVITERPTRIRYIRPIVEQLDRATAASLLPAARPPANGIKVYDISQLDQVPVATAQPRPQYPPALRRAGASGEAKIDFIIDPEGNVQNAYALTSTHPEFAESAVAAVSKWKFTPGRKDGRDVPTHMQVPIVFKWSNE